jgi:predicted permease
MSDVRGAHRRLLDAIRALPGVEVVGGTGSIPFGGSYSDQVLIPEGFVAKPSESLISPRRVTVTPGYFEAMGIPVAQGRAFDERDTADSTPVVMVDERLAQHFWPDREALDQRVYMPMSPDDAVKPSPDTRWLRVIGVVKPVRLEDLAGRSSHIGAYYLPYAQTDARYMTFAVKAATAPESMTRDVRAAVAQVDPELAMFDVHTMEERAELSLASRRTAMLLAVGFGGLALFISAIGTYGVLAYLISQRRREIGIRVALGSTRGGIVKLVFREGAMLLGVGVVLGGAGAFALRQAVASELYGVQPLEPSVLAGVALLLVAVTLTACLVPARRAVQVDPAVVLSEQ